MYRSHLVAKMSVSKTEHGSSSLPSGAKLYTFYIIVC